MAGTGRQATQGGGVLSVFRLSRNRGNDWRRSDTCFLGNAVYHTVGINASQSRRSVARIDREAVATNF